MLYLPPLRRLVVPLLITLVLILIYRSYNRLDRSYLSSILVEQPSISLPEEKVNASSLSTSGLLVQNPEGNHVIPPVHRYYDYIHSDTPVDRSFEDEDEPADKGPHYVEPKDNKYLKPLFECRVTPNQYTNHIRLNDVHIRRISMVVTGETENEKRIFYNAAPVSLPYWSDNQYLLITRVLTDGSVQFNLICEANICYTDEKNKRPGEKPCTQEDLELLGGTEGMRCAYPPLTLNVPPTPALSCGNETGNLIDIPGFHDPRVFWSGRGELLMMMNSQSRYACFGLWVIDLRKVHAPLNTLLASNPKLPTFGPLMSYPSMTEITRNPPSTRGSIEKNWMFFSNEHSTFVHYDLGPTTRTFAQLLGSGLTTPNLTDPYEQPCLQEGAKIKETEPWIPSWHQGTNSLRLILCERTDLSCRPSPENTVFWSLIHHKHKNIYSLPLRYERYVIVWSSTPPFHMLAMSSHPILFSNETSSGWTLDEIWDDDTSGEHERLKKEGKKDGKGEFSVFTYTPSIAYSWGREEDRPELKNVGFLDDEVILGVGIDDEAQGYTRIKVSELVQCMRACPGRASEPLNKPARESKGGEGEQEKEEWIGVGVGDDNGGGPDGDAGGNAFFEEEEEQRRILETGISEGKDVGTIAREEIERLKEEQGGDEDLVSEGDSRVDGEGENVNDDEKEDETIGPEPEPASEPEPGSVPASESNLELEQEQEHEKEPQEEGENEKEQATK